MPDRMPTLFVSHGAPSLLVDQDPTFDFFKRLGGILPRPKAVLCVSAHWERHRLAVSGSPLPGTIHDFCGFAEELYDMRYPCPGDPALAESVQKLMTAAACRSAASASCGRFAPCSTSPSASLMRTFSGSISRAFR